MKTASLSPQKTTHDRVEATDARKRKLSAVA